MQVHWRYMHELCVQPAAFPPTLHTPPSTVEKSSFASSVNTVAWTQVHRGCTVCTAHMSNAWTKQRPFSGNYLLGLPESRDRAVSSILYWCGNDAVNFKDILIWCLDGVAIWCLDGIINLCFGDEDRLRTGSGLRTSLHWVMLTQASSSSCLVGEKGVRMILSSKQLYSLALSSENVSDISWVDTWVWILFGPTKLVLVNKWLA